MGKLVEFVTPIHKLTSRDYFHRMSNSKVNSMIVAKRYDFDYWDGDRRICYGGYKYIPGRWAPVAKAMVEHYGLKAGDRVLDVGCGKGFQLVELQKAVPGLIVHGLDISEYAIENAHESVKDALVLGTAAKLPFPDNYFDYVFSINTLHNLYNYDLFSALREIERVSREKKYLCVESYRDETEKTNLLYWQVTCESFLTPREWDWLFSVSGYSGDHSFIFFE